MSTENKVYDLCICGAGYSGLVLAIKAARAGLFVCLVDLNRIVGRRILSTGNGRCNFTNKNMGNKYYYSNHELSFINDNHDNIINFFDDLGVVNKNLDGYYYPYTNQAKTIREALEAEINSLYIDQYLDNRVTDVSKINELFEVKTNRVSILSKIVVIASGGLAAATLGSSKLGYKIASKFGMSITKLAPALVGTVSKEHFLKDLAGVRANGTVSYKNHVCEGEIQFTKDGISGYPVMCISRFIGLDEINNQVGNITIDFVPYISKEDLRENIADRFKRNNKKSVTLALLGLCNEKIIDLVVSYSRIYADTSVIKLDNQDIDNLVYYFKNFTIQIQGTKGFDNAQVTAGGIDLNDINLDTMESKTTEGLYFIGEVLDVDGICGGYNLSFAYTSADIAANAIIKGLK